MRPSCIWTICCCAAHGWAFCCRRGGLDHLARIRSLCAPHLLWGDTQWETEIERYQALIAAHYQAPDPLVIPCGTDRSLRTGQLRLND